MEKPFEKLLKDKKAIFFTLDDVLFPEKDYLLQVYYLFSEFMAYTVQADAGKIVDFMKDVYEESGAEDIFEKVASKFDLPTTYKQNFNLLHENARLPLKLLLYKDTLTLLKEMQQKGISIILIAQGAPLIAINKIKQTEWNGLEGDLKVYFTFEYEKSEQILISNVLEDLTITSQQAAVVTSKKQLQNNFVNNEIDTIMIEELL